VFLEFFYLLRARGLEVSINEWMALVEALDKGLAKSSLTSFYYLCRAILIKSEADYDKFDEVFAAYFKNVQTPDELPDEVWKWLADEEEERALDDKGDEWSYIHRELQELLDLMDERLEEQKEKHHGGTYWVGTGGTSTMGRGGYNTQGIRVGGKSRHKTALQIAGERNFKDFREDKVLDIRQFQMAFRKLRQFSARMDVEKTELDRDNQSVYRSNNGRGIRVGQGVLAVLWRIRAKGIRGGCGEHGLLCASGVHADVYCTQQGHSRPGPAHLPGGEPAGL
jgi:uncharacterized protein with von Willebrand factor type A (vWA) domain